MYSYKLAFNKITKRGLVLNFPESRIFAKPNCPNFGILIDLKPRAIPLTKNSIPWKEFKISPIKSYKINIGTVNTRIPSIHNLGEFFQNFLLPRRMVIAHQSMLRIGEPNRASDEASFRNELCALFSQINPNRENQNRVPVNGLTNNLFFKN